MLKLYKTNIENLVSVKILVLLVITLNLFQIINGFQPPDLTFVVKNAERSSLEPVCFAEANALNFGIGWIYPIIDSKDILPKIVSSYEPNLKNDYDCSFAKTTQCSNAWKMENWQFSKFDTHCYKPILDTRWENFPTYLTSKELIVKTEIPSVFQTAISVRATKNAEIFLCEGWNPHSYPCYYVNIGGVDNRQAFLKRYKSVPDVLPKNDTKLSKFKSDFDLLFEEEWRHFSISLDENGTIKVAEINRNEVLLNYTDKQPLKPNYLFIRSKYEHALWKIHYNQYIFTNKTAVTQLGPAFGIYGSNLCIALYVSMCKNCKMLFFLVENEERIILKEVYNKDDQDELSWQEIRLLKNNILNDKIQLFIETKYANSVDLQTGFWAVDDVRICAENEIKITRLLPQVQLSESDIPHISCQALNFPHWRPQQHFSSSVSEDIKYNSSTSTSIRLSWKASGNDNLFQEYYAVQYEGKDICSYDNSAISSSLKTRSRQKSQGYVTGKNNDIVIQNLVPYTNYNITFWSLIQENKKSYIINTLPTDVPTKDELPKNFKKTVTDTSAEIEWDIPKCNETYGPLVYRVYVKSQADNKTQLFNDTKTKYKLQNLQPFTKYSVKIKTARKMEYLDDNNLSIVIIYNFTTLPAIAPKVENLELYSVDKHSASLRFNIPANPKGVPTLIEVQWCHPLYIAGCQSDVRNLTKCKLWENKYCTDIENLTVGFDFAFLVSLKNDNTHTFGEQTSTTGTALERIPGKPLNVTYEMIGCERTRDYCNLNISWVHPYEQNGTITMFDIILNETSYTFIMDTIKSIHEIMKIPDKEYQRTYSYVVKYIPFNTPYIIGVRAVNDLYKGKFASIRIKTDHIANYLDQTPIFVKNTNETIIYKLPQLDWRLNSSTLTVIVQDYDANKNHISDDIIRLEMFEDRNQLCNEFGETWVATAVNISHGLPPTIVIGDGQKTYVQQLNTVVVNKKLKPDTEYCITFTLVNQYRNSETLAVYHERHIFTEPSSMPIPQKNRDKPQASNTNVAVYVVPIVFIILLLACSAWLTYRYLKKRRNIDGDHIYESMPFDDYLPEAVSNQSYDKLIHS